MPEKVEFWGRDIELWGPDDVGSGANGNTISIGEAINRVLEKGCDPVRSGTFSMFRGSRLTAVIRFQLVQAAVRDRQEEDGVYGIVETLVPKPTFTEDGQRQVRLSSSATYADLPFISDHRIVCFARSEERSGQ
ncbi:MAG: hypothetical protein KBC26_01420 [Candidatus Pacebacteria bacterium]|nr:hypothetical protein [Candidatus Paceibacterota bacterium]